MPNLNTGIYKAVWEANAQPSHRYEVVPNCLSLAQGNIGFQDEGTPATDTPSFLPFWPSPSHPLPCPTFSAVSHALLLLSLVLWLLQYLLLVSAVSSSSSPIQQRHEYHFRSL